MKVIKNENSQWERHLNMIKIFLNMRILSLRQLKKTLIISNESPNVPLFKTLLNTRRLRSTSSMFFFSVERTWFHGCDLFFSWIKPEISMMYSMECKNSIPWNAGFKKSFLPSIHIYTYRIFLDMIRTTSYIRVEQKIYEFFSSAWR